MKIQSLIILHALTLAAMAQSTVPLMVGTNGNVLAPANFWKTAPVLSASDGSATNATFFAPLPVTNYDTSLLYVTNCTPPGGMGIYSNETGRAYEYVMNDVGAGADYWTSVANGMVRLYQWGNVIPLAQCPTNKFPTGLGGGFAVLGVTSNTTAITVLGKLNAQSLSGDGSAITNVNLIANGLPAYPNPKNLFNPVNACDGKYRSYGSTPGITPSYYTNPMMAVTGLLPVKPGNSYVLWIPDSEPSYMDSVFTCFDVYGKYIGMSRYISAAYNTAPGVTNTYGSNGGKRWATITLGGSSGVYFVELNFVNGMTHTAADYARLLGELQFELGTAGTAYTPYTVSALQLGTAAMPDNYSALATNIAWGNSPMRVIKAGNEVWIRTPWAANIDFAQRLTLGIFNSPFDNNQIELWSHGTVPSATADTNIAAYLTSLKSIQDDICPTEFSGNWMGANHGWNRVVNVGVSAHDKTAPDVGSEWTDSLFVKWYLVAIPSATNLWFLSAGTNVADFTTTMTGNLTHSSGATHTGGITVASKTIAQLYPSIKNQAKRMLLNGLADLTWDGIYNAQFLDVQHSYDIENLGSMLAYVRAHVGSSTAPALDAPSIAVDAHITTTYHFTPNAACTVYRTFKACTNLALNYDGVVQSGPPVVPTNGKLWQYIPKTTAFTTVSNGYNGGTTHTYSFTNLTDVTVYNDEIWIGKSRWAITNSPPDRFVQFVTDTNGNKTFGFACGYNPRVGLGQTNVRCGLITNAFYMCPGQKNYPFGVDSSAFPTNVPANTTLDLVGFRCPLNFTAYTNATAVAWYYLGHDVYWMADFHLNISDYVPVPADLVNRTIEVVESANAGVDSKFVTADGIKLTVTNGYGYVVLRLGR